VRLAAINWTAVGSVSTAVAAVIALIAIFATLWVYRRQNRLARAAAIRALMAAILRDSRQIHDLTLDFALDMAGSEVRAFRNKLGSSADADTFRKYFFQKDGFVIGSSFMTGYVASPAYSRLSDLWNEIDQVSAELRGMLKILYYAAKLIAGTSLHACYPKRSISLANKMSRDSKLADSYEGITNLDVLTLDVATTLERELNEDLKPSVGRLYYMASFVEDLYAVINNMTDRSVLRLSSGRRLDGYCFSAVSATPLAPAASTSITPEEDEGHIRLIEKLLTDLRPLVHAEEFAKLRNHIEMYKKTYNPDYQE
jgi:hypothetical protein